MAHITSNVQLIRRGLSDVAQALNPRHKIPGGRRLGDEGAAIMASGILTRTREGQVDAFGKPLAPLKSATLRAKARRGYPSTILVATGEMLSMPQLIGNPVLTQNDVIVTPGLDESTGEKIGFAEQGSSNRAVRSFVGIDKPTMQALDVLADEAIVKTNKANGG